MSTTDRGSTTYSRAVDEWHANCAICGASDPLDLNLHFSTDADGALTVILDNAERFEGYQGRLHGGIISVLFDSAMTHCLFAHGLAGVTASLEVRFVKPVEPRGSVEIQARITSQKSNLRVLESHLTQDGEIKAEARARFWIISRLDKFRTK